ncbi:MAG: hypothetical protein A3A33_00820 [Candidatus Yanofskybacteria bacterium RIFCSPLOWO2_01_FULL_49_25]|uniref:tRNA/rRNA methyltransferase SpoU type domain-containing protein n=1 Tax=Candidatus Yanofskybacteria bacterium RIFCSPLOWO2_01_FULL_49_25 TaxID=1802701 RepID=A0A1F8GYT5_9BACT|nr:MAG: hypothetical protein A3A33_00820 [Candidatus Yanofskybacteria bacterium RIFCSPLOWO2_01_FULL_49_25]
MAKKQLLYLILNNIRSAYNVGSIFRAADGAGVAKIYICGFTPTPDNPKIAKTALGAEKVIPWEYHKQVGRLIKKLKSDGIRIVALELHASSKNILTYKPRFPMALIVGNEIAGVPQSVLALADDTIEIPMHGKKESLNVSVATGIALYQLLY